MKVFINFVIGITVLFFLLTTNINAANNKLASVDTSGKLIYPATNYQEKYRNQFHYSPQAGWMNDINGIFYHDGLYHLTYQHYPYKNEWADMHWGYATSSDLLTWQQKNPALVPGVNSEGMAYSGTAFIDHNNTLGVQKGILPTVVMAFTDTKAGQSLVYSTNAGKTWVPYQNNPVLKTPKSLDKIEAQRDPKVFWYEPDNKWIMVLFEEKKGMLFFSSKNLIDWQYHSTFNAKGFWECPDMFEFTIEGSNQKKWVLMAPIGTYAIGDFNGEEFIAEQTDLSMFQGIDLYGGQSFFDPIKNRLIQFVWLGMWNRDPVKSTWNHSVSFPVVLALEKFGDDLRLTRTPIAEIGALYKKQHKFQSQQIAKNQNILSNIKSDMFDLQFSIDLTKTKAEKITFNIAGKEFDYNLNTHAFNTKPIVSITDKLDFRLLVDKGAIEVFINNGTFSYAEEFPFLEKDNSIGFYGDGVISLNELTLSELKSIW